MSQNTNESSHVARMNQLAHVSMNSGPYAKESCHKQTYTHTHIHTSTHICIWTWLYMYTNIHIYSPANKLPSIVPEAVQICRNTLLRYAHHTSVSMRPVESLIWMSTNGSFHQMDALGHTYRSATSRILMSRVTLSEFKHAAHLYKYEWGVTSHVWLNHITRINELCHTYKWVVSNV